jgi:RNA polymerase sigma factor (sigma-70 family)
MTTPSDAKPLANLSAIELTARCAQSKEDSEAWLEFNARFEYLIHTYLKKAWRGHTFGRTLAPNDEILFDLMQDVYMRLLNNDLHALKAVRSRCDEEFYSYLYTIADSIVLEYLRNNNRLKRRGQVVNFNYLENRNRCIDEHLSTNPEPAIIQRLCLREIDEKFDLLCGDVLSDKDRKIFTLYLEGQPASQIAEIPEFHMSVTQVDAVVRKVRSHLKRCGLPNAA